MEQLNIFVFAKCIKYMKKVIEGNKKINNANAELSKHIPKAGQKYKVTVYTENNRQQNVWPDLWHKEVSNKQMDFACNPVLSPLLSQLNALKI